MKFSRISLVASAFIIVLQACGSTNAAPTITPIATIAVETPVFEFSPIRLKSGLGFRKSWLQLYFTDPASPFADQKVGGVDGPVSAAIVAARESVDVALNSLGVNSVTEALIRVHNRGGKVRVVMETNNMVARANPQQLMDAGIPIVGDNRDGIMNDNFIVIDHNQVWTGSGSYTSTAFFKEDNDLVRIFSSEVADDYTKEFEEMFVADQFGPNVVPETPHPSVMVEGTQVEVLFSPDDVVASRLMQLLGDAKESIYVMASSFSSTELGTVIREQAARGVKVAGILGSGQPDPGTATELDLFRQAGLDIRPGNGPEVMNHRAIIIDAKIVVTGSYDFTDRAENENDGNVLIIHNEEVAQKFIEEFQRILSPAQP